MAIQVRRGANDDFDSSKMLPGELAVTTDGSRKVYVAFKAGDVKEMASKEEVQEIVDNFDKNVEQEIEDAKNAVIEEAEEQVQKVINKAYEVLESIPDDYEELAKQSDEAVRTKADAILCTVSGKSIVVKDSSNDYVRNLKPYGKTKQRTTTGKNLLENTAVSKTENGITFTVNSDKSITVNGTATSLAEIWLNNNMQLGVGESYILSGCPSGGGSDKYRLKITDIGYVDNRYDEGNGISFEEKYGTNIVSFIVYAGVTVDNLTVYPMIRLASITDPTYEIFTGGLPSPSMEYPQELENVGEWGNFLDLADKKTNGAVYVYEKVAVSIPKGTYTFSCKHDLSSSLGWWVAFYNADGTNIGGSGSVKGNVCEMTIDITENAVSCSIYFNGAVTVSNIMLNYGTTALPYRPYSGQMELESGVLGKNLFDYETHIANGNRSMIRVIGGETLYRNGRLGSLNSWFVYSNTGVLLGSFMDFSFTVSSPLKLPDDASYIKSIDTANTLSDLYIGYNSDATYEPYTRQSHINLLGNGLPGIPLGQTIPDIIKNSPIHMAGVYWDEETQQYWIGDTVDNESGEICKRTAIANVLSVQDKDSTGKLYRVSSYRTRRPISNEGNGNGLVLSNCYIREALDDARKSDYAITQYGTTFYIRNKDWETEEIANAAILENSVKVQYILAEPYTVPLTAGEIESYRALRSNYHVTTVVNDCGANMDFGYNADTKCYIDNKFTELAEKLLA